MLHGSFEGDWGKTFANKENKDVYLTNRQFEKFNKRETRYDRFKSLKKTFDVIVTSSSFIYLRGL